MKAFRLLLLSLAGALLVVQPVLACHCLEDLLADARATVAEEPACHESLDTRHGESHHGEAPQYESPQCDDCSDYEPAPAASAATAIASIYPSEFSPAPAIADHPAVSVRPQTVRNIGPPPAIPPRTPTPVLLKQRLLN